MADLVPYIYHETQDTQGSMLCAQHALNNLLGQHIYTAQDLADLATNLDEQENAELGEDEQRQVSQNMDDTGFFSLSVLENALQIYGLTLVSWRSEDMAPYHDHPESQSAFILNLSSHWLPLRRFASSPLLWYNLNSFLPAPAWVSPDYLKMVLAQAEEEGYSVFVIRELEGGEGSLPEGEADLVGLELAGGGGGGRLATAAVVGRGGGGIGDWGGASGSFAASSSSYATAAAGPSNPPTSVSPDPADPVAASLARAQANLLHFQREQAAVLNYGPAFAAATAAAGGGRRQRRQGDVEIPFDDDEREEASGFAAAVAPRPMNRFERQKAAEEEELRKAIEASLAESRVRGDVVDEDEVGVEGEMQDPAAQQIQPPHLATIAGPSGSSNTNPIAPTAAHPNLDHDEDEELDHDIPDDEPAYDFLADRRYYDDEDADLQAALRASLMDAPAGLVVPEAAGVRRAAERAVVEEHVEVVPEEPEEMKAVEVQEEEEEEEEPVVQELSPEELRRKRLERFK